MKAKNYNLNDTKLDDSKVFRDAVHNYIHVDQPVILDLINSKEMQRLRRIKQLGGTHLVYQSAEHSRFCHCLGVYFIVRKMIFNSELEDLLKILKELENMDSVIGSISKNITKGYCYLGVTEPALFGVNLKYVFPLVCGMIGSCCAAMISVGFGVEALSIGVGGLPGILSIKPEYYLIFLLAMAVAVVVPFTLTFIVGRIKLSQEDRFGKEAAPAAVSEESSAAETTAPKAELKELKSILDGKVMPIEEAPDDVFSQKIMGDGIAIEPSNTVVTAPADCDVSVVMADTGHACGLTLTNGIELLIHVGVDTVDMGGEGFKLLVNEGDHVKAGQPLIEFDPEKIRAAGHPCTTMLIVTAEGSASNITMHTGTDARAGETAVISWD